MKRRQVQFVLLLAAGIFTAASSVQAGWHHWCGSSGGRVSYGSFGSYGSSGGSSGGYISRTYSASSGGSYGTRHIHRSYYSTGGSAGLSYASTGGSSGGSSGGGLLSRIHSRIHAHRAFASTGGSSGGASSGGTYVRAYRYSASSGGSYGSHIHRSYSASTGGSSGGSTGSTYRSYYSPSASTGGSYGGSYGASYAPRQLIESSRAIESAPTPAPSAPATESAPTPAPIETSAPVADGKLTVITNGDAKILVNGIETTTTGSVREYVSRNLTPGFDYTYQVRAEFVRDGKTLVKEETVDLRAGTSREIDLAFDDQPVTETSLTVHVPADAKVYLSGNETSAEGTERVFRTTALEAGTTWNDYVVKVVLDRDGKKLTEQKTISLTAGDSRSLSFSFDTEKIAVR